VTGPFISAWELSKALASDLPPAIFDASLVLHSAQFDGDYRKESGRGRWSAAHIPTSHHVDVATQFSDVSAPLHYAHPQPQAVADELARLGVALHESVVVYDSTGTLWAARLWYLLRWIGVDVRVLDGGLAAWREAGFPVESGESGESAPRLAVANWPATAVREAWITRAELLERGERDPRPLICSLPAAQFTGSEPTRYTRRGHIPGSVNVSSRALFDDDGTVKLALELAAIHEAAAVSVSSGAQEILLYCGGGISASAGALALSQLGMENCRIYDESLEEWSADPALPLAIGS
jgi:thiosulfate/3-mercaptopyruvate sulfurtransferase